MHFAMSPDNLLFFLSVTASAVAAFGLFSLYRRLADRRRHRHHPGSMLPAGDPGECYRPLAAASSLLPTFMYSRLVRHSGKGASATECAVCLTVIQVGAMVKLLPACTHVYHVDCIDLWLASHWTCPLCRCRVDDSSRAGRETVQHVALLSPV